MNEAVVDRFMKKFKYYKGNKPPPSLAEVINVDDSDCCKFTNITSAASEDPRTELLGLEDVNKWQSYTFEGHSGLILIRNPFTSIGQRYWIRRCLEEYPRKPNKLNIDIEMSIQDWWKEIYKNGEYNSLLMRKLRWTTLGYHHDWDTKVYREDNKAAFPSDLSELCDVVAGYMGYKGFRAEAAIVNYYHMSSTLSAHTDHSEVNLDAPLFSFSFGQSAIFLIGGKDKSTEPSAVLLQSGDIMVMSKEARLCYHAVPKILPAAATPWNDNVEEVEEISSGIRPAKCRYIGDQQLTALNRNANNIEWSRFNDYVEKSRINVNVRQVLNKGQNCLC